VGCFRGRTEERKKLRHGGGERRFFEAEAGEVVEGWGVWACPREGGRRWGSAWVWSRHAEDGMGGLARSATGRGTRRSSLRGSVREGRGQKGGVQAWSRHTEEDGVGGLVADGVRTGGTCSQPVAASASQCHGAREQGNGAVRGLHVSAWACRGKEGAWLGPREQCRF
jgi:hypothetical protein